MVFTILINDESSNVWVAASYLSYILFLSMVLSIESEWRESNIRPQGIKNREVDRNQTTFRG